jgi:hypothetical protein
VMLACLFGICNKLAGDRGEEREGRRGTYGEEETIRNGEVSLNACAVAAKAASARIVHFIIAGIDAVPRL